MVPSIVALLLLAALGAEAAVPAGAEAGEPEPVCELRGEPELVGRIRGSDGGLSTALHARLGQAIDVYIRAPGRLDGRRVVFSEDGLPGHVSWLGSSCAQAQIRWKRIEPTMEHLQTPAPNEGLSIYANARIFGPKHGAWLGYDRIEYRESAIDEADDLWSWSTTDARPSDEQLARSQGALAGLGVMRLAATISPPEGPSRQSPGVQSRRRGQIADAVFRYTFRRDEGLFGWLTTFLNVPYIFGSAGVGSRSQAERYIGADCADLIVAALRLAGDDIAYTSVAGLVRALPRVAGPLEIPAPAGGPIPVYAPLPGDILAIDYIGASSLPRPWDHVVVVVEDRGSGQGGDGVLGPEDQVADIGDARGLRVSSLGDQGHVRVLALRPRLRAQPARQ
ncbi:MAG TPA: hypothetical protein ENJ18_08155 [Nannocystis exedens]|nr:hypothetical protein [Nannocystis exedens]